MIAPESWKQRLWRELHLRAACAQSPQPARENEWLREFDRRIHCEHCRAHWRVIVRAHPPDYSSRFAYFLWTVRAHNAVNQILGKPKLSLAHACALWRFDKARGA